MWQKQQSIQTPQKNKKKHVTQLTSFIHGYKAILPLLSSTSVPRTIISCTHIFAIGWQFRHTWGNIVRQAKAEQILEQT